MSSGDFWFKIKLICRNMRLRLEYAITAKTLKICICICAHAFSKNPGPSDHTLQKFQFCQTQRMLLAASVPDLIGPPGQQVRFRMSKNLENALQIAVMFEEAETQEISEISIWFQEQIINNKVRLYSSVMSISGHVM
jgi:hypothetical protein